MPHPKYDPIASVALRFALQASALTLAVALLGAGVRLLPWALDASISWATLTPFARSLLGIAAEASVLIGWPLGWALATARLVSRGEAAVLAALGESPGQTLARLVPQGVLFAVFLALISLEFGRDAVAPGRVVRDLLEEGRAACFHESEANLRAGDGAREVPATHVVPFAAATWLCTEPKPRLVGRSPLGGLVFSARDARVSDDLRRLDLEDAWLVRPQDPAATTTLETGARAAIRLHVAHLTLRGLAPFAHASSIPPHVRAMTVTVAGLAAAVTSVLSILALRSRVRLLSAAFAVTIGLAGSLSALGTLRVFEVRVPEVATLGWLCALGMVPLATVAMVLFVAALAVLLPRVRRADT